jgi:hypothetical protein
MNVEIGTEAESYVISMYICTMSRINMKTETETHQTEMRRLCAAKEKFIMVK